MTPLDPTSARRKIGQIIKTRRLSLGMSQIKLAQKIGKHSSTYIALIENGQRNIRVVDLICLAEAIGTTVSHIAGEFDAPSPPDIAYAIRASDELEIKDKECLLYLLHVLKS